jgi:hypothetical protein
MRHLLAIAAVLLLAVPAAAQFNSMQGDWWLEVKGDRGVGKLKFSEEQGSSFVVTGAGYARANGLASYWSISNDAPQQLTFDFEGHFSGTLQLEDLTGTTALGTLEITKGTVDLAFTKVKMKGLLTAAGQAPIAVKLKGQRLPTTPPAWIGRTHLARLGGSTVKSKKYDVSLTQAPTLGFPFLALAGQGSVRIDGVNRTGVVLGGLLLASPKGKLFGDLVFDEEEGTAKGKVKEGKTGGPPVLRVRGKVGDGRKVDVDATLEISAVS